MRHQAHITIVNGSETSALEIADRGLAYGDGIFETMRVKNNKVLLLEWHLVRLREGIERLHLGKLKALEADFKRYLNQALMGISGDALIKVIVTRGKGGRGYQPASEADPTFIVQVFDLPEYDKDFYTKGIVAKVCEHQLSVNPSLAGIKHLNRLDQVLASRELKTEQEGIVCDYEGNVIEGTKSNLFIFEAEQIVTPRLDRCGVRGVLRDFLLEQQSQLDLIITEDVVTKDRLLQAEGVVMLNSVMGCWPVSRIKDKHYIIDFRIQRIQDHLVQALHF